MKYNIFLQLCYSDFGALLTGLCRKLNFLDRTTFWKVRGVRKLPIRCHTLGIDIAYGLSLSISSPCVNLIKPMADPRRNWLIDGHCISTTNFN